MSCAHCRSEREHLEREHLDQLTRRIGQEKGERERLERLLIEVAEALRPVRGLLPHPIVDVWSRSAQAAQKALDAYASEKEPAQAMAPMAVEDDTQQLREALEIERAKVVDRERRIGELEDALRSSNEKHEELTRHYLREQERAEAGREALREMAKLL